MKARVKATGEIVDETAMVSWQGDDFYLKELGTIQDEESDYWTRLEHQYAGMAMQGLVTRGEVLGSSVQEIARDIAEISCEVAHALVERLKKEEEK